MGIFNPEQHLPGRHKLEDAEGVRERLDPDMKQAMSYISRGDLGIPGHALKAGAFQYAKQCNPVNQQYALCKSEEGDPRRCLRYGNDVSDCAANFYKKITDACQETFVAFSQCLELNQDRDFACCRPEQLAFDKCAFEKLGFDKAAVAVEPDKKIKTDRPKPYNPHRFQRFDDPPVLEPVWSRPLPKVDS